MRARRAVPAGRSGVERVQTGKMRARRAVPAGRSGVERVQTSGSESRRIDIKCYIRPDSSNWITSAMGFEKPPNNEQVT